MHIKLCLGWFKAVVWQDSSVSSWLSAESRIWDHGNICISCRWTGWEFSFFFIWFEFIHCFYMIIVGFRMINLSVFVFVRGGGRCVNHTSRDHAGRRGRRCASWWYPIPGFTLVLLHYVVIGLVTSVFAHLPNLIHRIIVHETSYTDEIRLISLFMLFPC